MDLQSCLAELSSKRSPSKIEQNVNLVCISTAEVVTYSNGDKLLLCFSFLCTGQWYWVVFEPSKSVFHRESTATHWRQGNQERTKATQKLSAEAKQPEKFEHTDGCHLRCLLFKFYRRNGAGGTGWLLYWRLRSIFLPFATCLFCHFLSFEVSLLWEKRRDLFTLKGNLLNVVKRSTLW